MHLFLRPYRSKISIEKPLRGEVLARDLLEARAIELADQHIYVRTGGRGAKLKQRFRENTRVLNEAYFSFAEAARLKEMLAAGAEWLLDNFHVIDEQVRDIRRDLPKGYYQALPKLTSGDFKGFPRVYQIVCDFISNTDSVVETDKLTTFIRAYQSHTILAIGEIWAIPIMLRLALVENLRRLAKTGLVVTEHRRAAEKLCRDILDNSTLGGADLLIQLVARVNQNPAVLDFGSAHIMRRLRTRGAPASLSLQWLDEQLRERGIDPNEVARIDQRNQAADQLSVGNSVTALKTIGSLNWRDWFEQVSVVDAALSRDPAQIYTASDFLTRDLYRHRIEKIARRTLRPELEIAEAVVQFARQSAGSESNGAELDLRRSHIGYYLIDDGRDAFEKSLSVPTNPYYSFIRFARRHALKFYLGGIGALTAGMTALAALYSFHRGASFGWILFVLLVFPWALSEWSLHVINWLTTKLVRPRALPKLNYEDGIPPEVRTAVVIQTIVADFESLENTVETLEIRAIGNNDPNMSFGILADFADAPSEQLPGEVGILERARELFAHLNSTYCSDGSPKRFFIFFRKRIWDDSERKFMGWERKRGKIMEFNRFLRGADDTSLQLIAGDGEFLRGTKYVITLDNDTRLPPAVAGKLVGTIHHPLNRAVFDEKRRVVTRGYGIIQPRVGITLQSANSSRYAAIFSGHTGLDPYTLTVSDIYQDLFSEGSYIGKGIYDVEAFEHALEGRFPNDALLSHDLIEGLFARCGIASDIEVFDDFPRRYHAQTRRQLRWMRGDWQLLPWLLDKVPDARGAKYPSPFSHLSWWKLFDNLRRTLVPISLFLSLIGIWSLAPGSQNSWHAGLLVIFGFPIFTVAWRLVFDIPFGYSLTTFLYSIYTDLAKNLQVVFYNLAFLPHQAANASEAILVTLYRLFISKKRLLEWETAAATEQRLGGELPHFLKAMAPMLWFLIPGLLFLLTFGVARSPLSAIIFFGLWFASPVIAWQISLPQKKTLRKLADPDREYLRQVAFSTWRYFDTFLCDEYNYLIPDNLQIVPQRVVAERTSPTNISLSLMSVISAFDLGFIPLPGVVARLSATFESLAKLERFHGHFLNWYDIRHLRPLPPRYISTVDSGNLVGHFIAIRATLQGFPHVPLLAGKHVHHALSLIRDNKLLSDAEFLTLENGCKSTDSLHGLSQAVASLHDVLENSANRPENDALHRTLREIEAVKALLDWIPQLSLLKELGKRGVLPNKLKNVERILTGRAPTLSLLFKVVSRLEKIDSYIKPETLHAEDREKLSEMQGALQSARERVSALDAKIEKLLNEIDAYVKESDFKFLYDTQKKLFTIGYNIDSGMRDNSFYDLLASEARLSSFVAIAKGDVPQAHWFLLNRALTDSSGGKALISWGGTMFEYLMPILVTKDFHSTLLSATYEAVVKSQRIYALRRGIPWGISESAYSGVDFEKTYQYRAFGIPGLGLKRGLAEDLVVSPYSTAMALVIDPLHSVENLKRLENDGVRGEFGFFEAVDYTPERLGAEERSHVVKSFLAHHQGMSLVSINNLLNGDIFQERFHSDPRVKACELLLQERFPTRIPVILPHQAEVLSLKTIDHEDRAESVEIFRSPHTRYPYTRVLSNRQLSVILDNSGSGGTFYRSETALTRFKEDGLDNTSGTFIYLRDVDTSEVWSVTYQPTKSEPEHYEAIFSFDKVDYKRREKGISAQLEVTVSPEDNVEVRRVTLANLSNRLRQLELTSFGEVALASVRADSAHPAFSKMFIQTEYLEEYDALVFVRLPRSEHDKEIYMMHLVCMSVVWAPTQWETSREKFLARGNSLQNPAAMGKGRVLSGTTGCVLDPIFALRSKVEIDVGSSQTVCYVTGIAETREEILQLIKKYREGQHITRAFEMAWSHSDVEIRHQQISRSSVLNFQKLANALTYNIASLRASTDVMRRSRLSQNALWRFGISGDEPIVLLVINDPEQSELAEELLLAHEYLRLRGIRFDLVILNEYHSGYFQDLQEELNFMIRTGTSQNLVEQRGGVFLRSVQQLSEEESALLQSSARVVLFGSRGSLASQLNFVERGAVEFAPRRIQRPKAKPPSKTSAERLEFFNGVGGFLPDGKSYQLNIHEQSAPPLPWVNVVANKSFGFLISDSGSSYTWADNSRENRLSPWSNDPLLDPSGEVIYIRDRETGDYWCPTPQPVRSPGEIKVTHSFGSTAFAGETNNIESELILSVSPEEQVKWWQLELRNNDSKRRQLEVFLYFEWVLGVARHETFRHIRSGYDAEKQMIYATNPFNIDFSEQVVFLGSNQQVHSYTTNRREFIGRLRSVAEPLAFEQVNLLNALGQKFVGNKTSAVVLSGTTGGGLDSCAVLKIQIELGPKEKGQVLFYVGKAANLAAAKEKSGQFRSPINRIAAFDKTKAFWTDLLSVVQIRTPSRRFDVLINGWLQYQTLACRMFARSGFYQSSGAIGFRDQLQDCMAFLVAQPAIAREQILLHASHQFPEGDVQHWWHPPTGRGIRTRISDNYLWLPFVVSEYLKVTGDTSILDEEIGFLDGPQLEGDKQDLYFTPQLSTQKSSLYDHCLRSLERTGNLGPHGLSLIGGGDWNDGMNNVGPKGQGESVWLSWFTSYILEHFSSIVESRGDTARADKYRARGVEIVKAIEAHAWDGAWYRRAYFDDGSPMGAATNPECQIDAIAQSWSVISGLGNPNRQKIALASIDERLIDREHRLVKLLWPPFHDSKPNAGYIQSYPPGLRENGGQYTHASCWTIMAAAMAGEGDKAFEYFDIVNPISHADSPEHVGVYRTEPYVTCGDVYANSQHLGRGGWSWYTGSSGWLYRVGVEHIVGLQVQGEYLLFDPCVPADWKEFGVELKHLGVEYSISFKNPSRKMKGVGSVKVDGKELADKRLRFADYSGKVQVEVTLA